MAAVRILRGDIKKGIAALVEIIQDFEYHSMGPPMPRASSSALADAIPFGSRTTARLARFLSNPQTPQPRLHRLMFLGALSTSNTFMEVFQRERDSLWESLLTHLDTRMAVINFYARSRQIPWHEALIKYFDRIGDTGPDSAPFRSGVWPANVPSHPLGLDDDIFKDKNAHTFYFRLDGGTSQNLVVSGSRVTQPMINIDECAFDRRTWPRAAPPTWPANRTYLDHPQNVRNATVGIPAAQADDFLVCGGCNKTFVNIASGGIGCTCVSWRVDYPCLQIHEYAPYPTAPNLVNKGVMAMQTFDKDEFIGEYVGMLLPPGRADPTIRNNVFSDDIYTIDLNAAVIARVNGQTTTMPGGKIADVSASWKGNWTRFINTSPRKADWNIELVQWLVADRIRILVRTLRPILFGEELIASYGTDYMKSLFGNNWTP